MEIKALDSQRTNDKPTVMPQIPFSSYVVGAKKNGKTTMLLNILINKDFLKGKFNKIIWSSPTVSFDEKVMKLYDEKGLTIENKELKRKLEAEKIKLKILEEPGGSEELEHGFEAYEKIDMDFIQELIDEQKAVINKFGKSSADNILIVLDDSIKDKILKSTQFADFIFKSRHYKISIFFLSQDYFSLPKALRLNSSQIILFSTGNKKEIQQIFYENGNGVEWKQFFEIFKEATYKPYSFLGINYDNTDKKYRFLENFDYFIVPE